MWNAIKKNSTKKYIWTNISFPTLAEWWFSSNLKWFEWDRSINFNSNRIWKNLMKKVEIIALYSASIWMPLQHFKLHVIALSTLTNIKNPGKAPKPPCRRSVPPCGNIKNLVTYKLQQRKIFNFEMKNSCDKAS